jgi:hypothetical protein
MDEMIDAMDLIVVVWHQERRDWYLPTWGFRILLVIMNVPLAAWSNLFQPRLNFGHPKDWKVLGLPVV